MKTLSELYDEILASDDLKKEFFEAGKTKEATAEFLKKHECSASVEEFLAFLKERAAEVKELSQEELSQVAGGDTADNIGAAVVMSFAEFGYCVLLYYGSIIFGNCV